jgi:hypothetical protein
MRLRLFLTCWVLFCLHFATDFVREHYLVVSIAENASFDLSRFEGMHEDIFRNPERAPRGGVHHGANPGISMLAAVPYLLTRPLVDRVVAGSLAARRAAGTDTLAVYDDPRPARVRFYRQARAQGLDVRFGLVGIITMVLCMAPLSALGVVVLYQLLGGVGLGARLAAGLALLYAVGTPVLFRTAYLNQNLAIGVVSLAAFYLLWDPGRGLRWSWRVRLILAGLLGGFAFLCDYSGALATGFLGLYAMVRGFDQGRSRGALRAGFVYAAAASPMILLLWFYQWAAFGSFILPPQHWMPAVIYSDVGYQGVSGPQLELLRMLLLDSRFGLFVSGPLFLLALAAPIIWRRGRSFLPGREMLFCFGLSIAYVVFFSAINFTRLQWSTGIRYLMPIVPFLFLAAAVTLVRLPRLLAFPVVTVAILVSVAIAMVRNQYGTHLNVIRLFVEGPQLPWLTTLGKMSTQYLPWLEGRPSAVLPLLLAGAAIAAIWLIRSPLKPVGFGGGRRPEDMA